MKFIITMKLSDRSLKNHILPITRLNRIDTIIMIRDSPGEEIDKVTYLTPPRIPLILPVLVFPLKLFQIIVSSLKDKPILIHSFLLFPHGYLAFIAGKITGRKVGVSLIAGPVETYTLGGSPIGTHSYCQPLPKSNLLHRLNMLILKRFDVITVTGTFTRNFLIGNGIDKNNIWILPHVVDDRFRPINVQKEYDVIFVGRLVGVKHVETIIRAISVVKESFPSVKTVIIGEGEERQKMEDLTRSLSLTDNVEFTGFQSNTWEWYNRSRISLLSSEREGFPYTVIESIKCGVPVIISDCGDVNDVVIDSFNGRIIPDYTDYKAYSEAIIELIGNPDLLACYAKNCLKTFDGTISKSVDATWELILADIENEA